MNELMEKPLLGDNQTYPTKSVLEKALGDSYPVYEELIKIITGADYGLVPEWNYYKDGKAWLCKVCLKNKTIFWLSVWDKYFKTGFYFTAKNSPGILELDIDTKIKEDFNDHKPVGKLCPLVIDVNRKEQIRDVLKVIEYKKKLK